MINNGMFEQSDSYRTARSREHTAREHTAREHTAREHTHRSSEDPEPLLLLRRQLAQKDRVIQSLWLRIRHGEETNILLRDKLQKAEKAQLRKEKAEKAEKAERGEKV